MPRPEVTKQWIAHRYAQKIKQTQEYEKQHGDPIALIQALNEIPPEKEADYVEEFKGFKYVSKKI